MKQGLFWILIPLFFLSMDAQAKTFPLPAQEDSVVGQIETLVITEGDTFHKIARAYDLGYYQLVEANPGVNPDHLQTGTIIIIPNQYVLPNVPREGIVVNLAELRIYYYPKGKNVVMTYPVGIGRRDWETPLGELKVIERKKDPTWFVPESIRAARAEEGVMLPKRVKPGPDNPLGRFSLRLSKPTYLIHGTNEPEGVGRRSSAGCLRLYPEDIEELYPLALNSTKVNIINAPYKAGWSNGKLYLEAHLPLEEQVEEFAGDIKTPVMQAIDEVIFNRRVVVNWDRALDAARSEQGLPIEVGSLI